MVTGNGKIIGKNILTKALFILLPGTAGIFIDPAKIHVRSEIFIILASKLTGFAAGTAA
jgi:hypothetical protein